MKSCPVAVAIASALAIAASTIGASGASAQSLPAIKAGGANKVPECATPGRMMAFIAARNAKLDPRFHGVATAYMRHGEDLAIRWDYAFFQMILETGGLAYQRGNGKPGDVKPAQNNFAGLGATGKGEPGESFASIDDGVKAHLQHLQMYAGEQVANPIAERTRKVQEWKVLTSWQSGFKRPITYADLAAKWAPGSKAYASDVKSIAGNFYDEHCAKADPKPELVQEARGGRAGSTKVAARKEPAKSAEPSQGSELARQANERARAEGDSNRSTLGAKAVAVAKPAVTETAPAAAAGPAVTVLNETRPETPTEADASPRAQAQPLPPAPAQSPPVQKTAAAAAAAKAAPAKTAAPTKGAGAFSPGAQAGMTQPGMTGMTTPPATTIASAATAATTAVAAATPKAPAATAPTKADKCRVWTASYGGQKSVVIRSNSDQFTNYTVLDVNDGQETREVEAYIAAYAKGGQRVAEFPSQNAALDKAFQLCPEG